MKDEIIDIVKSEMLNYLSTQQMTRLNKVLEHALLDVTLSIEENKPELSIYSNEELLSNFLDAKNLEGCSTKTIKYYRAAITKLLSTINKSAVAITTEDIRKYLSDYQKINNCSKSNLDNIRRILSSFFMWLENENYILKSPVRRIHKIRTTKPVKETITDESMEIMRDNVANPRDLAIIDMLASTGMRVGELCRLNITDIDFEHQECVVLGKGDKERIVYFDARAKVHLRNYLNDRDDDNPALFVSLLKPHKRLEIPGVECRLRMLGRELNIKRLVCPILSFWFSLIVLSPDSWERASDTDKGRSAPGATRPYSLQKGIRKKGYSISHFCRRSSLTDICILCPYT